MVLLEDAIPVASPKPQTTASVVIITYARPEYVRTCLEHLRLLTLTPLQVIVVDASPDRRTHELVIADFPEVTYLRNDLGPGTMPESRQIGLAHCRSDVVAFIDDDAFVDPDWLTRLVEPYADPDVAAVGGRATNGLRDEEEWGVDSIGRLLPDGRLTGHFGAHPGRVVDVDHLLGANMSFRRSDLLAIGGIRGDYPGTCLCEESDISLRLRARGRRLVFTPFALVRHIAAPYTSGGKRFDQRWVYYSRRNHVVLLARVYGFGDPILRRYLGSVLREQREHPKEMVRRLRGLPDDGGSRPTRAQRVTAPRVFARSAVELTGVVAGLGAAVVARRRDASAGVATPAPGSAPAFGAAPAASSLSRR